MMRFLRLPNFLLPMDADTFDTDIRLLVAVACPGLSIIGYAYGADKLRVYEVKHANVTVVLLNVITRKASIEIRLVRLPGVQQNEPLNRIHNASIQYGRPLFLSDQSFCYSFYGRALELGATLRNELHRHIIMECLCFDSYTAGREDYAFTELGLTDGQEHEQDEVIDRVLQADENRPIPITRVEAFQTFGAERLLSIPPHSTTDSPVSKDIRDGKDEPNSKEPRQPYGPRSDTLDKIDELRRLRHESRNFEKKEITLDWIAACQLARIEPRTVKQHAPELARRWDHWEYWDN